MPIGYSQEGYRPTTALANLATQGIAPIDVTRGGSIQYAPLAQIQVPSAQPELVAQGISSAMQSIGSGILSPIKAKWESEQAVKLEEAKRTNKALDLINQQRLELAAKSGTNVDYPEQDAALVEAGKRIMGLMPSGYTPKEKSPSEKPAPTIPTPVEIVEPPSPGQTPQGETAAWMVSAQPPPAVVTSQPPPTLSAPAPAPAPAPALAPAPTPAPQSQTLQDILPAPDLTKLQKPPTPIQPPVASQPPIQPPVFAIPVPEQPADPRAPRNLAGFTLYPSQSSEAHDTAAKLSTPYRTVTAVQDNRNNWIFTQKDTSADVQKMMIDRNVDQRAAEELVLKKNADDRAQQKADSERLDAERKRLAEDNELLKRQKSNVEALSTHVRSVDKAIEKVRFAAENYPEAVGALTRAYTEKYEVPVLGDVAGWNRFFAYLGIGGSREMMQQIASLQSTLKSVQSQVAWKKFAELKALSPTGSTGVGALSDPERESLAAAEGSLDIVQSPDDLLDTLYHLRNGAIKGIVNASKEIKLIDKSFVRPNVPTLRVNPYDEDRIKQLDKNLSSATEEEKKTREYSEAMEKMKSLIDAQLQYDEFNKNFIQLQ